MLFGSLLLQVVPSVAYEFGESRVTSSTSATTYTYLVVALGAAGAKKVIVAAGTAGGGAGTDGVASIKIHVPDVASDPTGVTLSLGKAQLDATDHCQEELWYTDSVTGATGTVVIVWNRTAGRCAMATHALTKAAAGAPTYTAGNTSTTAASVTINCPAGGAIIAGSFSAKSGSAATTVWTGITEKYDESPDAGMEHSGAASTFATTQTALTVTATYSATVLYGVMPVVSWGPA
jgi:hypothetical protein